MTGKSDWRAEAEVFAMPRNNQARQKPGWCEAGSGSAQAACTYVIGTMGSDAVDMSVGRTVFGNDRCIDGFACVDCWKCKRAGCQYGEGQAKSIRLVAIIAAVEGRASKSSTNFSLH